MESAARHVQSPSVKGESVDGRRPRSSGGNGETPKKTGMGAKEMEATVSTLHKQNFDLKLELFHRRERQTALEARIDALETEKTQMDDVNDRLLDELEKRDKAVQEAVQMIVNLEAQVAMLLKEREMVRHFDAAGIRALEALEHRLDIATPKPREANLARREADAKALNRMPSFLSDHTENTENLRNVYLSSRGSLLSLSMLATEGEDADARRVNDMTSPSLSVLSESSFTSVYGEKDDVDRAILARVNEPSPDIGQSPCSPKPSRGSDQPRDRRPPTTVSTRSSRNSRSSSFSRAPGPGQFQSIRDIVDHTSPLQQLANLDHGYPNRALAQDQSPLAGREQSHKHVKDTKREAPRRVMTDTPVQRPGEQVLPPTPDTVSTPTLRRFKTSNDTLSNQRGVSDQRSYRSSSDGTSKEDDGEDQGGAPVLQQPPRSTFVGRQEPARGTYFDTRAPLIPRPRSAGETTVSHRHDVDWDSDGDSVHSLDSSLDIWMQQGKDPKHFDENSYDSPDLFSSIPMPGGGWNHNTTVGPSGDGTFDVLGVAAAAAAAAQYRNHVEDMNVASNALFPGAVQQPPTPKRRSSLGATGLTVSKQPPANGKLRKSPSRAGSRRASIDAHAVQRPESVASTPQRTESKSGARSKDSHYPPSSTTASRGHRLNFFRRSISGGPVTVQPEPASPAAEPSPTAAAKASTMGVPSWVQRSHLSDDDRESATPPPIMRNPRPARSGSFDEGAPLNDQAASATTPTTPMAATRAASHTPTANATPRSSEPTPTSTNGGSGGAPVQKHKWLPGFSRGSSLRNRAG
ncbi:uncharacterized protein GLRG_05292 [Colletotrichum graminicola M1.001]|uniref:Centrosomin N-terminal motif 1 domain-containing protein n=1 Tax=Colletotrichum graminicola (strain M1.001 / M2 / FGSC 10212) TaxID=645133 RepID=E3QHH7_COLGM|nr:uncharacterized protein GLRG_05292 [Colletotrichum graminicola M1.001]EFQ30148.1 hypothetical protein GLRG_05292 [Colletotrichum graminicola M1.001]